MTRTGLKALRAALGLFLSLCVILTGCRRGENSDPPSSSPESGSSSAPPAEAADYPVEAFGKTAKTQPVRVVSLSPAVTELLCAFGYGDRLFGVSDACDYPEMVGGLPRCGTSLLPDMEEISRISPDYLLTETPLQIEEYWMLADLDVDVEVMEIAAPQTLEQLLELYREICVLMDGAETGRKTGDMLAELYEQQLSILREKVEGDPAGGTLSAVFIIDPEGITAAEGTLYHEVMSALGLVNAGDGQPDLVLYGDGIPGEKIEGSEIFGQWEAVRQERMIAVPMAPLERLSPRMFDMLEQLANQIYTAPWLSGISSG